MKKITLFIAAIALVLVTSASFSNRQANIAIGENMPATEIEQADDAMNLSTLQGKWIILSFWSAADAPSRIAASQTFKCAESLHSQDVDIDFISVNFDRSESLMNEIATIDGIGGTMFHIGNTDTSVQLRRNFCMNQGLRTFLINPAGQLEAVDPSPATIYALVS